MKNRKVFAVVVLALAVAAALAALVWQFAPTVLGSGPYGIDLRPTPEAARAREALPAAIADYSLEGLEFKDSFLGAPLGPDAVIGAYEGPRGRVAVVAARLDSPHDAAAVVADLARRLEETGCLDSRRLRNGEPYKGWWSASGKRNFAAWYADDWGGERSGFAWQSGHWFFAVASADWKAKREVARAFPY